MTAMQEIWVWFLGQKIPWRREWQPTPVFLPGKSHGQKSLVGYSSWGCKELDRTEQLTQSTNSVVLTICYSSNRKPIHRWTQSIYCWCIVDLSRVHEQPFRLHCFYQPPKFHHTFTLSATPDLLSVSTNLLCLDSYKRNHIIYNVLWWVFFT